MLGCRSPLIVIAMLLCRYRTHDLERRVPLAFLGDHTKAVVKRREETMIKTMVFALFGLALASAAQAMPSAPVPQPDSMITQARMGCGAGMVMVNGACVTRTSMRHARRCARWNGGVCAHYY